MENFKISLRIITEDNFIEAFNLKFVMVIWEKRAIYD